MSSSADPGRPRVLIVDDEEDLLMLVVFVLDEATVLTAADAATAREILERETVDVLLLDVTMPHVDGPTLLRQLRAEGLAPEVVFLVSALPRPTLRALAAEADALPLSKPFTAAELRGALADHLAPSTGP